MLGDFKTQRITVSEGWPGMIGLSQPRGWKPGNPQTTAYKFFDFSQKRLGLSPSNLESRELQEEKVQTAA